jgi:hypothetical protein
VRRTNTSAEAADKATREQAQWRQLAFCMSQLAHVSDKSFGKFRDNLACYADKLSDTITYEYIRIVIATARKQARLSTESKVRFSGRDVFCIVVIMMYAGFN